MTTVALESPVSSSRLGGDDDYLTISPFVGERTLAEYMQFENNATEKHELISGKVIRMAGASGQHNLLASNILRALGNALEEAAIDADVVGSDQKIYIDENNTFYPDVVVFSGGTRTVSQIAIHNPLIVVEVLSASTSAFDHGRKFRSYQTVPSLRHYVLIEQKQVNVTHYARTFEEDWVLIKEYDELTDILKLSIDNVEIAIPLSRIYRRVSFVDEDPMEEAKTNEE